MDAFPLMRRIFRHTFNVLSVLSLLLCAATAVLWMRSYRTADFISLRHTSGDAMLQSTPGSIVIKVSRFNSSGPIGHRFDFKYDRSTPPDSAANILAPMYVLNVDQGDAWVHLEWHDYVWVHWQRRGTRDSISTGAVPFWSLVGLQAMPPFAWLMLHWRSTACKRRRTRDGLCARCGYDLRATPDRCPECGTVSQKPPEL